MWREGGEGGGERVGSRVWGWGCCVAVVLWPAELHDLMYTFFGGLQHTVVGDLQLPFKDKNHCLYLFLRCR